MQARRIARELALLSLSQMPSKPERLNAQSLQDIVVAAVRTLASEARDTLETASAELQRSNSQLLDSETRASSPEAAKEMLKESIRLTQEAINRLGHTLEIPEFLQLSNQKDVRNYALEILGRFQTDRATVDAVLNQSLVDWQLNRLAGIDRDLLRIAVVEMMFLGTAPEVAINEAVELAKRYSEEDGHRFINGVLRRAYEQIKGGVQASASQS
ncbi:transcription antitermination factor NusB [Alkalinema sp. FACHB-956]|uniref:transcription antitermination factor NusB n=1 Tax=Alkalinema sp. FACHB-956 TaxID=2692768 RepID=UPI001681DF57|nr:transcription antitermination factor NusB [Alkalinema sp. FACHB-956]MBD2327036.1 transcription antitermination protein NusB [Alkalinema sp. FACHB-956]